RPASISYMSLEACISTKPWGVDTSGSAAGSGVARSAVWASVAVWSAVSLWPQAASAKALARPINSFAFMVVISSGGASMQPRSFRAVPPARHIIAKKWTTPVSRGLRSLEWAAVAPGAAAAGFLSHLQCHRERISSVAHAVAAAERRYRHIERRAVEPAAE